MDSTFADASRGDGPSADVSRSGSTGDAAAEDASGAQETGSRYRALIVEAGPLAYFRLGESRGSAAQNEIPPLQNGAYRPAIVLGQDGAIADDPNTAARFNDGGCLELGGVTTLTFSQTDSVTIELWVKPTVVDVSYRNIFFESTDHNGKADTFALFVQGTGSPSISFERHQMGNATTANGPGEPPLFTFTYVAAVYDSMHEEILLYIDGRLVSAKSSPGSAGGPISGGATVACGGGGPGFEGTLDEVAIYARALGASEIVSHYNLGRAPGGG